MQKNAPLKEVVLKFMLGVWFDVYHNSSSSKVFENKTSWLNSKNARAIIYVATK